MKFQALLEEIYNEVQPLFGQGQVADYIPALGKVDPRKFGISIQTVNGQSFETGDANEKFSIQSISKVFNLAMAIRIVDEQLWERVGVEPSGNPFNSLVQLEHERGIPRNPFINSGAQVVIDILLEHLDNPNEEMLSFVKKLRYEDVYYNDAVFQSEKEYGYTNQALVNFMKAHKNIMHPVDTVLDVYYHQCSIEMSCHGLAKSFLFLANNGIIPDTGERILTKSQTKRVNALMLTCGFYDQAGMFAYHVGLPGKSGVGGGIVAVIPEELSIAVWSPELNTYGNSVIGMKVLELLTTRTGKSVF
ncbi:MAG: glutaminase [Gammaproteobacteria bacterium]|nr:glutaminase [Gammaproteobacteria bacterium]|tara:strand:- start:194474 stop:195385 length:912 start_codon:yes stop_codon:yes gene_type:complete